MRLATRIALAAAMCALLLVAAELLLRATLSEPGRLTPAELAVFVQNAKTAGLVFDPEVGCAPDPASGGRDAQGIQSDPADPGAAVTRRVLFLGDSVVSRGAIQRGLRLLDPNPTIGFLNAGVESWNPVQSVAWCERHQQHERAEHLVFVLHNNDFRIYPAGLIVDGGFALCVPGGKVPLDPVWYDSSILYRLWIHARHGSFAVPTPQQMAGRVSASLARLQTLARGRGARLTVLLLPIMAAMAEWTPAEQESRELALQMLRDLGLETIDLLEPIEQMIANGFDVGQRAGDRWHPNDLAGIAMAHHARRRGLFVGGDGTTVEPMVVAGDVDRIRMCVDAGAGHQGRPAVACICAMPPSSVWWRQGMPVDEAWRAFEAAGGRWSPIERIGVIAGADGRATVELTVPVGARPGVLGCFFVFLNEDRTRVEAVSDQAPLFLAARR